MDVATGDCHAGPDITTLQTREEIEGEITRYLAYVAALRTHLNTFTPISVLPPEVLCEVFLHVAGVGKHDISSSPTPYRWISVSHVCKHWRAVALNCPVLWGNVTVTPQVEWMTELLERSKSAPLYVSMTILRFSVPYFNREEEEASTIMVFSHLARMRSLSITAARALTVRFGDLLTGPAPCLESLTIRYTNNFSSRPDEFDCIHELLHRPENSRLRRLDLHSVALSWSKTSLPHLTHLTVTGKPQRDEAHVNVETLLGAVARMGLLEELVLEKALSVAAGGSVPAASTPASLPRLQSLRVVDSVPNCIYLLDYVATPSLSRLSVHVSGDIRGLRSQLFAAIAAKTSSLGTLLSLLLTHQPSSLCSVRMRAFSKCLDYDALKRSTDSPDQYPPELEVSFAYLHIDILTSHVCSLFPFRDIRCLFVAGQSVAVPEITWHTLFKSTRKVTQLTVMGCTCDDGFPYALLHRHRNKKKKGTNPTYQYVLPRLRLLTLADCYLGEHGDYYDLYLEKDYDEVRLVDSLLDCFIERYEYGAEIEKLRILSPVNATEEEIEWLREVVRIVEWDGVINYDEPDSDDMHDSQFSDLDDDDDDDDSELELSDEEAYW
ncbi:hypothetical protein DAEQUDRAFT_759643 [Daedalea quercina L-15889]|uniref:F-box domain-containing protein n=1 Tax=Daedalea quercina L-15889 TaxID=1314783 RepID=A0A165LWM5_9APHY|nr:hypothetical protein DAEQUDRAFT_759643 [Daedalea quercina L-15889]